jgi:hypothetical protein
MEEITVSYIAATFLKRQPASILILYQCREIVNCKGFPEVHRPCKKAQDSIC